MECIYGKKDISIGFATESKHSEHGENKEEEPAPTVVTGEVNNCVSSSTCVIL